ncbi:hypothetical protein JCM10213v2_007859 [Rhodosporidiobolus nylandii]
MLPHLLHQVDWRRQNTLTRLALAFLLTFILVRPAQLYPRVVYRQPREIPFWHPGDFALHLLLFFFALVGSGVIGIHTRLSRRSRSPLDRAVDCLLEVAPRAQQHARHLQAAADNIVAQRSFLTEHGLTADEQSKLEIHLAVSAGPFLSHRLHHARHPLHSYIHGIPTYTSPLLPISPETARRLPADELDYLRAWRRYLADRLWLVRSQPLLALPYEQGSSVDLMQVGAVCLLLLGGIGSRLEAFFAARYPPNPEPCFMLSKFLVPLTQMYGFAAYAAYTTAPIPSQQLYPVLPPLPASDTSFATSLLPAVEILERVPALSADAAFRFVMRSCAVDLAERSAAYWSRRLNEGILDAILAWKEVKQEQERKRK